MWLWVWGESYIHGGKCLQKVALLMLKETGLWDSSAMLGAQASPVTQRFAPRRVVATTTLLADKWTLPNRSFYVLLLFWELKEEWALLPSKRLHIWLTCGKDVNWGFLFSSSNTSPSSLLSITDLSKVTREETAKQNITGKMSKINYPSTSMGNAGLRNKHCIWSLKIEQTGHSWLWYLKPT